MNNDVHTAIRLPSAVVEAIERQWRKTEARSPSDWIRRAIVAQLKREGVKV